MERSAHLSKWVSSVEEVADIQLAFLHLSFPFPYRPVC